METIFVLVIFFAITGGLGYRVWKVYNLRRPNAAYEEITWQRLAKAQNLNFTAGGGMGDTFVSGTYRGHFLILRTLQKKIGIHTLISLNRLKPSDDMTETDVLSRLISLAQSGKLQSHIQAEEKGKRIFCEVAGVETNIDHIRSIFNFLHTLMSIYPKVVNLGGEAIPMLRQVMQESQEIGQVCLQMMEDIGRETTDQLSRQMSELWCPKCVARFATIEIDLAKTNNITFCGCRVCGQSRQSLQLKKGVVAILDNQDLTEQIQQEGELRVNWLSRNELFDFERVEIKQATDEEVERFAVQVGNDTDEVRCHRYKEMGCNIYCELSTNTMKILQSIFGSVKVQPASSHLS